MSAIAVMSVQGLLDCKIVHESVDGDVFYDFVHTHLIPHLQPFDGCSYCKVSRDTLVTSRHIVMDTVVTSRHIACTL